MVNLPAKRYMLLAYIHEAPFGCCCKPPPRISAIRPNCIRVISRTAREMPDFGRARPSAHSESTRTPLDPHAGANIGWESNRIFDSWNRRSLPRHRPTWRSRFTHMLGASHPNRRPLISWATQVLSHWTTGDTRRRDAPVENLSVRSRACRRAKDSRSSCLARRP
jgi:hypothetical protein